MFANRVAAGMELAEAVAALAPKEPVVLALPRGGVPVAAQIAGALKAPLDLIFVRKLGAPSQPELALGAIVDGAAPQIFLNEGVVGNYRVDQRYIRDITSHELGVIESRRRLYKGDRPAVSLAGKTAIIVDDGIATGATVHAAILAARAQKPLRIVLAVPVASREALATLRKEVDDLVCLQVPDYFGSVGTHYADFSQTEDAEVIALLDQAMARQAANSRQS